MSDVFTTWGRLPVRSWCADLDPKAAEQAVNLANHPAAFHHIALMPDAHVGFGMPIGGVLACENAVVPNAVGVDIGCGMCAVQTTVPAEAADPRRIRAVLDELKRRVPMGEGRAHRVRQAWNRLDAYEADRPWRDDSTWDLAYRNLGTLGGGNHFLEIQAGDDGFVWLMLHSGSRNLGLKIANAYQRLALRLNERRSDRIPDRDLAFLPLETPEGRDYIADMEFALAYARENRRRMMAQFREAVLRAWPRAEFLREINIHHNYAARETHFGRAVWVHRKGATSARAGELGIIPGSMGTPSYIVRGLGSAEAFQSCSHGAGRRLGRQTACRTLSRAECDAAMAGIVFDGWKPARNRFRDPALADAVDLEEAPAAYKDIHAVMQAQRDLVEPLIRLRPLGVLKG